MGLLAKLADNDIGHFGFDCGFADPMEADDLSLYVGGFLDV